MLPIEATALIGSLAGIAEIAKSVFGDQPTAARAAGRQCRASILRGMKARCTKPGA